MESRAVSPPHLWLIRKHVTHTGDSKGEIKHQQDREEIRASRLKKMTNNNHSSSTPMEPEPTSTAGTRVEEI